jgi:Protein of unknown function (DUF1360)
MGFYRFLLGTLFVWRITHLLNAEDGPWDVVVRLRRQAGEGFFGQALDCFYCLSMWIAAPVAIGLRKKVGDCILLWPALSAGAILLERVMNSLYNQRSALYVEDSEDYYAMLREQKNSGTAE